MNIAFCNLIKNDNLVLENLIMRNKIFTFIGDILFPYCVPYERQLLVLT